MAPLHLTSPQSPFPCSRVVSLAIALVFCVGGVSAQDPAKAAKTAVPSKPIASAEQIGYEVVYQSFRNGDFASTLFAIDVDGKKERQVSVHAKGRPTCMDPAVSPDGAAIAFTRGSHDGSHNSALWLMAADGSEERRISKSNTRRFNHGQIAASWSPDGKRLVYVENAHGSADLFIVQADGLGRRRLTKGSAHNEYPAWSPDGKWIAYMQTKGDETFVHLISPDGAKHVDLAKAGVAWHPCWSPASDCLVVASQRKEQIDLFVIGLDGQVQKQLTDSTDSEARPAWSPDGEWVAYAGRPRNGKKRWRRDIYIVHTMTGQRRQLTDNAFAQDSPAWAKVKR